MKRDKKIELNDLSSIIIRTNWIAADFECKSVLVVDPQGKTLFMNRAVAVGSNILEKA